MTTPRIHPSRAVIAVIPFASDGPVEAPTFGPVGAMRHVDVAVPLP